MIEFEFNMEPDYSIHFDRKHGVSIEEIDEALNERGCIYVKNQKDKTGKSKYAYSKLKSGRFLKILFRKKENNVYFIITALDAPKGDKRKYLPIWENGFKGI